MDADSFGVWPPKLGDLEIRRLKKPIPKMGPQNFPPSLVELYLYGGSGEEEDVTSGSQLSHMLPSSLTRIQDLPEELLPSLLSLNIMGCPEELKEKASRRGSYWPLISYIPYVETYSVVQLNIRAHLSRDGENSQVMGRMGPTTALSTPEILTIQYVSGDTDIVQLETAVSTISQEYLLEFTFEYGISEALHPKLPGPEERIVDFPEGKAQPKLAVLRSTVASLT
nr:hypothetical protein [Tanacetum cinerariifolium]